ncbi:SRPBCC family protein [Pseudonocardia sp. GCM10023141]|uniref:SRPBCC family protein n=1 Tax=Pseudonocardia sp. GCM10023141 TaxID=3252653 RepID=UPI003612BC16
MVDVSRTLTVRAPLPAVVDYLKDFAHAESWDPGTVTCVPVAAGPIDIGSEWRNVSVFRGKETTLVYRLEKAEPQQLVFVGNNKTATSTDTISFVPVEGGTTITYHAHVVFHGLARLVDPFMKKEFDRLGDELIDTMTAAVEAQARA